MNSSHIYGLTIFMKNFRKIKKNFGIKDLLRNTIMNQTINQIY